MTTYQYRPLEGRKIRLLVLLPGEFNDPLCGYLYTCDFVPTERQDNEDPYYGYVSDETDDGNYEDDGDDQVDQDKEALNDRNRSNWLRKKLQSRRWRRLEDGLLSWINRIRLSMKRLRLGLGSRLGIRSLEPSVESSEDDPGDDWEDESEDEAEEFDIPLFEAVSYCWGDQSNPERITIHDYRSIQLTHRGVRQQGAPEASISVEPDIVELGRISIGPNLASGLHHLRRPQDYRVLWCDSICINQQDLEERAEQVKRMGDIFREAWRVVVWLGPGADDSPFALRLLEYTGSQVKVNLKANSIKNLRNADPDYTREDNSLPFSSQEWLAIHKLLARSWFKRLWVRQEITLANSSAVVAVGPNAISWSRFIGAVWRIGFADLQSLKLLGWERAITNIVHLSRLKVGMNIWELINYCRGCECLEDQDRLYALLGLLGRRHGLNIDPNYRQSAKTVFQDLVLSFHQKYGALDIFRFCEEAATPTWVPDLHQLQSKEVTLGRNSAAGRTAGVLSVLAGDKVEVLGVRCGIVAKAFSPMPVDSTHEDFVGRLVGVVQDALGQSPTEWDHHALQKLTKGILAGIWSERSPGDTIVSVFTAMSVLEQWCTQGLALSGHSSQACGDTQVVLRRLRTTLSGNAVLRTEDGEFGVGLRGCQEGDLIYAIFGCHALLILRRLQGAEHRVIGSAYIQGYSDGEALLGELPPGWRIVYELHYPYAIFEKDDGDRSQKQDPRLQEIPLPDGWCEAMSGEDVPFWFREEDPGDWTRFDPRLTPEALTERGVPVEKLVLV